MKKLIILSLSALTALSGFAQGKVDPSAAMVLDAAQRQAVASRSALVPVRTVVTVEPTQQFTATINLDSDEDIALLEGYDIIARNGDMAIVRVTPAEMQQIVDIPQVQRLSLGNEAHALMNTARAKTGIDDIQKGAGVLAGRTFTGKGVIAGLMDQGMDVNHINFLDANGEPRTNILWTIKDKAGIVKTYDTPQKIKNFSTDDKEATHGTHVLGIMAGSYKGPGSYAFINSRGIIQLKKQTGANSSIPYYGIATDAELAVACGDFMGSNVELGIQKVVDYGKAQGKPTVVNVSIGNTYGPHDGTDARSQYISRLGEDAIIVFAAGNEGDAPVSLSKTFTASDNSFRFFNSASANAEGIIDFWGADDSLFGVTFIAYDKKKNEIVYSYKFDENLKGKTTFITGSYYTAAGYIHNAAFDAAFGEKGVVVVTTNVDPVNNRYNVFIEQQLQGSGSDIVSGFIVEGRANQRVDAYTYGGAYIYSLGVPGYIDGNSDCSINGLACGDNILVVGSYTNVDKWLTMSGQYYAYTVQPTVDAISDFSSYGTTFDGRVLPEVCAPGGSLMSSYSKYYIDHEDLADSKKLVARYEGKTRNSYWNEMQGTSMAAPFVSGIIATWLEADPTLTLAEIKDIIKRTSTHDAYTAIEPHRWGAGKINALAGLKEILNLSAGVSDITIDDDNAPVEYFNLQGVRIDKPASGIVIRRQGNNVTKEVIQ